jgi:uncharacterized protein (TIGR03437 family)
MQRNKIVAAKIAVGLAALAVVIYAHAAGPDPGNTAAPGESAKACSQSGCHVGTALNGGGGSVQVSSSAGANYTPGQSQTLTVAITDSKAHVYGFQMSARNSSNGQAGDFTAGAQQIVICPDDSLKTGKACPAQFPIEYIEHSRPFQSSTITVQWTAPSSDIGPVTIYVAANAANGDTFDTGDHIYTATLKLTAANGGTGAANKPAISPGGVISASGFNPNAGIAPGTWVEIYGTNLATTPTRNWAGSDFKNNTAPTSLDNVSVSVGGVPAFVEYISESLVDVLIPDGIPLGDGVPVVLTNANGASDPVTVHTSATAPALLTLPFLFNVNGKQYVVAQFSDLSTYVGAPGLVNGLTSRPAKPGDIIVIYGIGFGGTAPKTPAGSISTGAALAPANIPTFRFGQTQAQVQFAGMTPGTVGLCQFNIKVPNVPPGDQPLNVDVAGASLNQNLFITIGQ